MSQQEKQNTFACVMCGEVFQKAVSDEDAEKEMKSKFGDSYTQSDCVMVCDTCYKSLFN